MKRKLFGMMGMAALSFGLVLAGCENGTQEVEGTVGISSISSNKAPQVGTVTVTKTTNKQYYIVSWDAAAEDVRYDLYFKQEGKKSSATFSSNPQNTYKYDLATGSQIPNDNLDQWSVRISSLSNQISAPGSYQYGVRTTPSSGGVTSTSSDVVWAAPITVSGLQLATAPVATKITDGSGNESISVTWGAVTGADGYRVALRRNGYDYDVDSRNNLTGLSYTFDSYLSSGTYRVSVTPVMSDEDIGVLSVTLWSNTITVQ